jgi:ABC-2 type transport system ATP-binding protein
VIAHGTPRELKQKSVGQTRIEVRLARPPANGTLGHIDGVTDYREFGGSHILRSARPPQTIVALVKQLESEGNELQSLEMFSPSLEDVFIELTGRRLRE